MYSMKYEKNNNNNYKLKDVCLQQINDNYKANKFVFHFIML